MSARNSPQQNVLIESATTAAYRVFVEDWRTGRSPSLAEAISKIAEIHRGALFPRLLATEVFFRRQRGEGPTISEYLDRWPEYREEIRTFFRATGESVSLSEVSTTSLGSGSRDVESWPSLILETDSLVRIGRYQLDRMVGLGGFAVVWRAYDPSLDRPVAVKVPRSDRATSADWFRLMLDEARRISRLKLSGVVPVYDLVEDNGRFFIVSEFMEGGTLTSHIQSRRLDFAAAARLVATVAETLHQAHLRNIVHRDIKPGNILLDAQGSPWVSDFGLATTETEQWADYGSILGSLQYMSPEQARGENHLVDGRTDIYSLGMVFYELLTGRVAFLGRQVDEVLEQILKREPRPLRTIDDAIPEELERICLKCLSKGVIQRYSTAGDLAKDLRAWLASGAAPGTTRTTAPASRWHIAAGAIAAVAVAILVVGLLSAGISQLLSSRDKLYPKTAAGAKQGVDSKPDGSHERAEPASTEAVIWRQRLGRDPQELIWPGYRGKSVLGFRDEARVYEITSQSTRLLELGSIDNRLPTVIALGLAQPNWSGGCGVFLGYRIEREKEQERAAFQFLSLSPATRGGERKLLLRRGSCYLSPVDGTMYPIKECGEQVVPWPRVDEIVRLEFQIGPSGLRSGRFGNEQFTNVLDIDPTYAMPTEWFHGPWGLYHERGTSWFQDPAIKRGDG
jgi:serine/threonine protein kinase